MLVRSALACFFVLSIVTALPAIEPYNPYAPVVDEPAIREDGKINWPAYFKNAGIEAKFQSYFQMGSCVGTNMRIVKGLEANKVDVNKLGRTTIQSQARTVAMGGVAAVDKDGNPVDLFIHPKGVSKIEVSGKVPASMLKAGMIVRFLGAVDSHAKGKEAIEDIEVISNTPDLKPTEVTADKIRMILGKVERNQRGTLVVNTGVGSLRKLTFSLPGETSVSVHGSSLDLVGPGDVMEAEGPLFTGDKGERSLFAEKLTVKKVVN